MMRRWVIWTLAAILVFSIVIRLMPLFWYAFWGSDTGEHFLVTDTIADGGFLFGDYEGWGMAYPFFAGAYILAATGSAVCGTGILGSLVLILPIVAALGVLPLFLLGRHVYGENGAPLLAAGIMATSMPHVMITSHAVPGTVGDFLVIVSILLWLRSHRDSRFLIPLFMASAALVPTHHLSAFFLILPIIFYTFVREFVRKKSDRTALTKDMIVITSLLVMNLSYWLWGAGPFGDKVMSKAFDLDPLIVIGIFALILALGAPAIIMYRRSSLKFTYTPPYPQMVPRLGIWLITMAIGFLVIFIVGFVEVPGTNIEVESWSVVYLIPVVIIISLAIIGVGCAEFSRRGFFVFMWLLGVAIMLGFSVLTANTVFLTYRVLQYFIIPAALAAGWGVSYFWNFGPVEWGKVSRLIVAGGLAALIIVSGLTAYPPKALLGGFEEGIMEEEAGAVSWVRESIPSTDTFATDHRMSSMLFGFAGVYATWDSSGGILHGNLAEARDEIQSVGAPYEERPVDYVLIDDIMKEGVALEQWETAKPMSEESIRKFGEPPFMKIYESNGLEIFSVEPVSL
jgi:hypothetical protein